MSGRAHLVIMVGAILTIAFIIRLVRKHHLRTKYSLLWIVIAVAIGFLVAFPNLLDRTSRALGIYYPPAFLLLVAVSFLFLVVVQFSWELSRSDERLRRLAEEHALLRAEVDRLRSSVEGGRPPSDPGADGRDDAVGDGRDG